MYSFRRPGSQRRNRIQMKPTAQSLKPVQTYRNTLFTHPIPPRYPKAAATIFPKGQATPQSDSAVVSKECCPALSKTFGFRNKVN
jgi:hypothetical protein